MVVLLAAVFTLTNFLRLFNLGFVHLCFTCDGDESTQDQPPKRVSYQSKTRSYIIYLYVCIDIDTPDKLWGNENIPSKINALTRTSHSSLYLHGKSQNRYPEITLCSPSLTLHVEMRWIFIMFWFGCEIWGGEEKQSAREAHGEVKETDMTGTSDRNFEEYDIGNFQSYLSN